MINARLGVSGNVPLKVTVRRLSDKDSFSQASGGGEKTRTSRSQPTVSRNNSEGNVTTCSGGSSQCGDAGELPVISGRKTGDFSSHGVKDAGASPVFMLHSIATIRSAGTAKVPHIFRGFLR